jgi:hypothetical protein
MSQYESSYHSTLYIESLSGTWSTAEGDEKCIHHFGRKHEGKRPVGKPSRRCEDVLKWILKKESPRVFT